MYVDIAEAALSIKNKVMQDLYGNKKPVLIEIDEWWFNGRIIQKQDDNRLPTWISFEDNESPYVSVHDSKKEAIQFCLNNPCKNPDNLAYEYIR